MRREERSSSGWVEARPPFRDLVMGVRRAEVTTMSVGCLVRIEARPRGRDIVGEVGDCDCNQI